jgi:dATP pyrophosphohydrolase
MVTVFVVRPTTGDHEFLQLHRAATDYLGDTWQLVRGGIEPGETAVVAALRELREETGLTPREFYRLGSVETFYIPLEDTLWHSVAFCALVDAKTPIQLNDEHDDFRWVHRERMAGQSMWASERALLSDLFTDILDNGIAKPYLRVTLERAT